MSKPKITIVSSAYNEEAGLPAFFDAIKRTLFSSPNYDFTVLLVDDGSEDSTWQLIEQARKADARFQGIRLSRNFGPHVADTAGLFEATGDAIAIVDSDLQNPPEVVLEFLEQWRLGAKIVWGSRRTRQDPLWRRIASRIFSRIMRKLLPENSKFETGGFILMDRQVVDCFKQLPERNRFVAGLVAWTGFEQAVVEYDRAARTTGRSGWSVFRMFDILYSALVGFSPVPIRVITCIGLTAFALSVPLGLYLFYCKWAGLQRQLGWTGIMFALDVLFGIQFLLTGVMGEYLYRIYTETIRRPLYFVAQKTREP